MATISFRNGTNSNLRDVNKAPLTGAGHKAVVFTGTPGDTMVVDVGNQDVDFGVVGPGECDVVDSADGGTFVAFKLADGVSLALVAAP